jgi:DNA-binding MarR family transcriptional regulator
MNLQVNGTRPEAVDKQIDFKKNPMMLIGEVARLMSEKIRVKCDDAPIVQKSGRILMIELAKKDGRTQLDLANATHLKAPTISVALQKLEKEGFVYRRPDEYDLRATRVFLTEKGRSLDDSIRKSIVEEEAIVTAGLTDEEKETLAKILLKIKKSILSDTQNEGDLI